MASRRYQQSERGLNPKDPCTGSSGWETISNEVKRIFNKPQHRTPPSPVGAPGIGGTASRKSWDCTVTRGGSLSTVSPTDGESEGGRPTPKGRGWRPLAYAVEQAGATGTTLMVTINQPHPSNWFESPARPVLPTEVADTIRVARAKGWDTREARIPLAARPVSGIRPSRLTGNAVSRI